jgi:hypothetical protein
MGALQLQRIFATIKLDRGKEREIYGNAPKHQVRSCSFSNQMYEGIDTSKNL